MKTFIMYQTEIPDKFKEYDTRSFEEVIEIIIQSLSESSIVWNF